MDKRFTLIIVALVLGFAGIFWFSKQSKRNDGPKGTANVQATNHTEGGGKKNVTLIEYGDFECPACGQYFPILEEVKRKYGDDITFQFRHFPLPTHPQARAAHRAAEAAGRQGKFFEMHDLLYERQQTWAGNNSSANIFESYASELGLNLEQYRKDVASEEVNAIINADIAAGRQIGATATPTFVLNGKVLAQNPRGLDDFLQLIEEAIRSSSGQ